MLVVDRSSLRELGLSPMTKLLIIKCSSSYVRCLYCICLFISSFQKVHTITKNTMQIVLLQKCQPINTVLCERKKCFEYWFDIDEFLTVLALSYRQNFTKEGSLGKNACDFPTLKAPLHTNFFSKIHKEFCILPVFLLNFPLILCVFRWKIIWESRKNGLGVSPILLFRILLEGSWIQIDLILWTKLKN